MNKTITGKRSIRELVIGLIVVGCIVPLAELIQANTDVIREVLPQGFLSTVAGGISLMAWRIARDYWKHDGKEKLLEWCGYPFIALALTVGLLLGFPGCASMKSTTINADLSSHTTKVVVPPFSKQKLSDFKYEASVNFEGDWKQSIGSVGQEIDTTAQAEVANAISAAVGSAVGAAIQASVAPTPVVQALPHIPDILDVVGGGK